jgi:hypothetical protein
LIINYKDLNIKSKKINVKNIEIVLFQKNQTDYISLTDIAKHKDSKRSDYIVQNWMRNYDTVEFLGLWEKINNKIFNSIEFDGFRNRAGSNSFSLTPKRWIKKTNAIGIISKSGRYGGTYAHKDIAFEFASWISAEFKLYLIKEFQRLKEDENERLSLGWDTKRTLAKVNYKIHTDAIKKHIIPPRLSKRATSMIYANEADVLNVALFGMTAKDWRDKNPNKKGNIRDYSLIEQLVCLSNLESLNAEFIRQGIDQSERLKKLNEIAIIQMRSLLRNKSLKKLKTSGKK